MARIDAAVSYETLARWARGGMAEIFLARQVGSAGFDKLVALKVMREEEIENEDFRLFRIQPW